MNKDYRVGNSLEQGELCHSVLVKVFILLAVLFVDNSNKRELQNGIKVSFIQGLWSEVCRGTEVRIPLQLHEYTDVYEILKSRSQCFDNISVFPGQKLSYFYC